MSVSAGDTQPTERLPEWAYGEPAPQRRRVWPWIVTIVIVVALAVAAWFAGEAIARGIVTSTIRTQAVTQLALPPDQQVDVAVGGAVIPQLIAGSLDDVTITSDDVPLGALTGDVTVHATGVPIRGDAPAESGSATIRMDVEQLRALLSTIDGLPAESVDLAAPNVTMSTTLQLFGLEVPVGIGLTPSAADGDIVLTPASLQVAGAELSADDIRAQFGRVADGVVRDWTICVAEYIPAGVTLTSVAVVGDELVADAAIDGAIITDPALQANGTCA